MRAAAHNNAELCDLVGRGHGLVGEFGVDAWTCSRRPPPLYPDAVTLDPGAWAADVLGRIDPSAGASVKDSFAVMDLTSASFRVLFSAEWILCAPRGVGRSSSALVWSRVDDAAGLREWSRARGGDDHDAGTFAPVLDELVVLRGDLDGVIVAGAIVNDSEVVVGVSNFFLEHGDPVAVWSGLLAEITTRSPGLAIVGYESGAALQAARRAGFRSIGPLRVWINE